MDPSTVRFRWYLGQARWSGRSSRALERCHWVVPAVAPRENSLGGPDFGAVEEDNGVVVRGINDTFFLENSLSPI